MSEQKHFNEHEVEMEKVHVQRLKENNDFELERERIELERERANREGGIVGRLVGIGDGAKLNTAVAVMLVCLLFLFMTFYLRKIEEDQHIASIVQQAWDVLPSIITLVLGYIFGTRT